MRTSFSQTDVVSGENRALVLMALSNNTLVTNPFVQILPETCPFRNLPWSGCLVRSTPYAIFRSESNIGEGRGCSHWCHSSSSNVVPFQHNSKAQLGLALEKAGLGSEKRDVQLLVLLALVSVFERTWTVC